MRDEGSRRPGDPISRVLSGALGVGVLLHDGAGRCVHCNAAGLSLLGLPDGEPSGRALEEVWRRAIREDGTPFPADTFPPAIVARTGGAVTDVVMGVQRSTGALNWIRIQSAPIPPADPDGVAVVTTLQEVTERGLLEQLLALQAALTTLPVGVVVGESSPGGRPRVMAYNDHFREMVGSPPPEGDTVKEMHYRVFEPDRRTELAPAEWPGPKAARLGQAIHGVELHVLRSDGTWRVLLTSAVPFRSASDSATAGAVVVALDVTSLRPAR